MLAVLPEKLLTSVNGGGNRSGAGKNQLGTITKRGDTYLRNLLIQGAKSVVNMLARICYATHRVQTPFGETERPNRSITRETFVMPA